MKKYTVKILVFTALITACAVASIAESYGQTRLYPHRRVAKEQGIHIQTDSVWREGSDVHLSMLIEINDLEVKNRQQIRLNPVLWGNNDEELLCPPVVISGQLRGGLVKRYELISKDRDSVYLSERIKRRDKLSGEIDYHIVFPLEKWMNNSHLTLYREDCGCDGEFAIVEEELLRAGIKLIDKPVLPAEYSPQIVFIQPPREEIKRRTQEGQAYITYRVGKSNIDANLANNTHELDKIRESVNYVRSEESITISGIMVNSYASPEGTARSNQRLSEQRAESLSGWIRTLNLGGAVSVRSNGMGEDWTTLADMIKKDVGINDTDKAGLQSIIDGVYDLDQREARMKGYRGGSPYRYVFANMYPMLRRSDYKIEYTVPEFTLEKSKELFKTRPGLLSLAELYAIANEYEQGSEEFNQVFDVTARLYADDKTANLNAAAAELSAGNLNAAERILSKYQDDPQSWINMGILKAREGDIDAAESFFKRAQSAGIPNASDYLESLEKYRIERDNYEYQLNEWQQYGF